MISMISTEGLLFITGVGTLFGWGIATGIRGMMAPLDPASETAGRASWDDDRYRIVLCPTHAGRILTEEEGRDLWRTA